MAKSRIQPWIALLVLGAALLFIGISGLWIYMRTTATPIHPKPQEILSVPVAGTPPKWDDAVEQARQVVRASLAKQNLPGISVAVGIGGEIVWAEGFGFADLEKRLPVSPRHRFRIGTASKVLTSAAVGLLLEGGRLKLDDEIQKYVPAFPEKRWPVTLRQLMAHVAGVPTDGGDEGPLFTEHCEKPVDALRHFANQALLFEPGTRYRASSYAWIVVSAAIEAAAGVPFLEFMRQRVFEPLKMGDTVADSAVRTPGDQVTFYFPRFIEDPTYGPDVMRDLDYSCYAGASVFQSTPSDLVRFGMALNGGKLLKPNTLKQLQDSQRLASGQETGYGLGWDLETVELAGKQTRVLGHDGSSLGGMVASLMTFPEQGIVVAVTSNISYTDTFHLAASIAQGFAGQQKRTAP